MAYTNFIDRVKRCFVLGLRTIFEHDPELEKYRYSPDKTQTKIVITPEYPYTVEFYPAIVVNVVSGDISVKYLQDEIIYEEGDNYVYSGPVYLTVDIYVYTLTHQDRDILTDRLILLLRLLGKYLFRRYDIEYFEIHYGGEDTITVNERLVYLARFSVTLYSEFKQKVDLSLVNKLQSLDINATADTITIEI